MAEGDLIVTDGDSIHNEWLLHRALFDAPIEMNLRRESRFLLSMIAPDELLLAATYAGRGFGRPGVLAVTSTRLVHVYFRRLVRSVAVFEASWEQIKDIRVGETLEIRLKKRTRVKHFLVLAGRADEFADCARRALARSDFWADQRARGPR